MVVVLGIITVVMGVAVVSLQTQKRAGRVRGAIYRVRGVVDRARSAALTLGPANNTARVTAINNCPADFNGAAGGRAGLLVNTTVGVQGLTFVNQITRNLGANPPTFQIFCTTVSLENELNGAVQFDPSAAEFQMPAGSVGGTFFVPFSSRGFVDMNLPGPVPGVARIVLRSTQPPLRRQVILLMSSGFSCLEGNTPGSCARTDG